MRWSLPVWTALAVLTTGCASGGPDPSITERVGALPGVTGVSVTEDVLEEDGPPVTEIAVTLDDDPTTNEVTAVLTELTDPGTDDGNARTATYVGGEADYRSGAQARISAVRDVGPTDDVEQAAQLFVVGVALSDSLGGEAAVDVDHDPEVDNDDSGLSVTVVPASDSPADVDAAVDAVADDPVLRAAGALVAGQELGRPRRGGVR